MNWTLLARKIKTKGLPPPAADPRGKNQGMFHALFTLSSCTCHTSKGIKQISNQNNGLEKNASDFASAAGSDFLSDSPF